MSMLDRDYFSDLQIVADPHSYFEAIRKEGRAVTEPHHGVVIVTGYDDVMQVLMHNDGTFSSAVSVVGPVPPLPFDASSGDLAAELERHRPEMPWSAHLTTMDGRVHAEHRALLMPLLTYKRLKANENFLQSLASRIAKDIVGTGVRNVASDYAHAVATYAISDLMGIPEADRAPLVALLGAPPSQIEGDATHRIGADPLIFLKDMFDGYLRERQENPSADLMSELVQSRFKDGREPTFDTLSNLARFLFGAGQDTTSRLVGMTIRVLAENPDIQAQVRAEPERIPNLLEEVLRWDGPVKMVYRLAMRPTSVGGRDLPAGTIVGVALTAGSNDPGHFPEPRAIDINRPHLRDHLAFSRGAHGCIGAPLARLEARVAIEQILAATSHIRISEEHHGPREQRRYRFEPTYSFRSLSELYVELTPALSVSAAVMN